MTIQETMTQASEPGASGSAESNSSEWAASRRKRIVGVDAARGLALVGMIAIHVLPAVSEDGGPTLTWTVAAGVSATLFTFLAGVSLALSTGGRRRLQGKALNGARIATAVRALILIVLGMLLAILDPPAGIILTYYGVMFLMAIPLLGASAGVLAIITAAFALFGSAFVNIMDRLLPHLEGYDPSFGSLLTSPDATLSVLFVNGTFPALAWMTFICAGLAVGRADLRVQDTQLRLMVGGLATALGTWAISTITLYVLGGWQRILAATPGLTPSQLEQSLTWGTGITTPEIASGWRLLVAAPYSETPVEILNTLGWAVFAFGAMLLIGSRLRWLVRPLALIGTMTLTLYAAHLIFIATGLLAGFPVVSFWLQLGAALLFVVLYRNLSERTQGPLEWVTATTSQGVRDKYLERQGKT